MFIRSVRVYGAAMCSGAAGLSIVSLIGAPTAMLGQVFLLLATAAIVGALFVGISWLLGERTLRDLRR